MKRSLGWGLVAVLLGGCASSPAPGWHSLMPAAAPAEASAPMPAKQTIVVGEVTVPDEVDRPQLVVRNATGTPAVLDGERWSEPLKAQLPRALALALARRLPGALVATSVGGSVPLPTWRVGVDVQRFELQRGPDRAVLRVVWTLRPGGVSDGRAAAPAAQLFEAVVPAAGGGPAALVAAMAAALEEFSGQMSRTLTPRPLPQAGEGAGPAR